ncbi:MAG: hypothetical protein IKK21_11435 [Clostridia bacterium]|nr:hypothetical protein [Clostridia bacterium]
MNRRLWQRVTAGLTLLVAAAVIVQTLRVFLMGYTRDHAALALAQLVPVFALWLLAAAAGAWFAPAARRETQKVIPAEKDGNGRLRVILYAIAAVLVIMGVMNGGMRDVLIKAINICTECIGLG